jgi:hypothetical protein
VKYTSIPELFPLGTFRLINCISFFERLIFIWLHPLMQRNVVNVSFRFTPLCVNYHGLSVQMSATYENSNFNTTDCKTSVHCQTQWVLAIDVQSIAIYARDSYATDSTQ